MTNQQPQKPSDASGIRFPLARRALTQLVDTTSTWRRRADAWADAWLDQRRARAAANTAPKKRSRDWDLDIDESEIL